MKRFIALILIVLLGCNSVFASDFAKFHAGILNEFNTSEAIPEQISFSVTEEVKINDEITIPAESTLNVKVFEFQKEKRWHKSGFFICNLLNYTPVETEETVDVSDKEIYFIARKYEPINKKEAGILGTEIILTQAASIVASCFIFLAPVDVAYFFAKGAIQREKHPNWFKAGVSNAYDNSLFWFWLKGKPIDLEEGESVKLKEIPKKRAEKINSKIANKNAKKLAKQLARQQKREKSLAKNTESE